MSTTVISNLPDLGTIADITYIPVETSGITQKISGLTLKNYVGAILTGSASSTLNGDLSVGGQTTMNGTLTVTGNQYVSGVSTLDILVSGNAQITSGNIAVANGAVGTLESTNFSTGNAQITGGSILGIVAASATTAVITNFSTANAIITGGAITNINGSADTFTAGNFSSGNALISGGVIYGFSGNASVFEVDQLRISSNIIPTSNATSNIGSSTNWFGTIYGVSNQAKYADLAEKYTSDADYEPGTVVVFGDDTEVTISKSLGDNRVAGVVTTNPAYLMNAETDGLPVALTGRVPCKVIGKIRRGDMLVTSDISGVATYNGIPEIGTVIGKALGNYDNQTEVGVIEVVVGRL